MQKVDDLLKENTFLKQRITLLEEMLRLQRQKQFGASSEKDTGGQGQLFNEAEADSVESDDADTPISVPAHTRKKSKRASIPADLPRVDCIYDLPDAEKMCPHDGAELTYIGDEISEQLDIEPAKINVLRHRRKNTPVPAANST